MQALSFLIYVTREENLLITKNAHMIYENCAVLICMYAIIIIYYSIINVQLFLVRQ